MGFTVIIVLLFFALFAGMLLSIEIGRRTDTEQSDEHLTVWQKG